MKINLNKYIIYYIILLFISIIFYINFIFFKSFFYHYEDYIRLYQLKSQDNVYFWNYKYNTQFSNVDISNLELLNKNFSWAKNLLYSGNEFSYKKLYNLWNIYLLQAYDMFIKNETWYIDVIKQAISVYNTSLENMPSYAAKKWILSNLNIATNFLNFAYVYYCDNLFVQMIEKTIKIDKIILDNIDILIKQENALNKWLKYDDLKSCIESFKDNVDKNINILYDTKNFFDNVNKWLISFLKDFQQDEISCYQQSPAIKLKYKESIDSSYYYYEKFLKQQKDLLNVFQKANKEQIKILCENKDKLNKNQEKENQKMSKNFYKLQDLKDNNQQQRKQQEKQGKEKKEPVPKDQKRYKDEVQSLQDENKNLIEQIQNIKTQNNYDPLKYIQELFKNFYANDNDFKEGKKENSVGK